MGGRTGGCPRYCDPVEGRTGGCPRHCDPVEGRTGGYPHYYDPREGRTAKFRCSTCHRVEAAALGRTSSRRGAPRWVRTRQWQCSGMTRTLGLTRMKMAARLRHPPRHARHVLPGCKVRTRPPRSSGTGAPASRTRCWANRASLGGTVTSDAGPPHFAWERDSHTGDSGGPPKAA